MASSESKIFRRLLESLQPYPDMRFLLFAKRWGELEEELLQFCKDQNHSIQCYEMGEFLAPSHDRALFRSRAYRIEQSRYNLQGRLYNHAFVTAIPADEPLSFAKKLYSGLVNAGSLYLFCSKEEALSWQEALEAANYVASSLIELNSWRCIVSARKMHGWGG